ncbi:predicted protein [Nematostella vectensis]|uniref:Apple domain-containing protein n=1 Tax=Nematostella vectensis TaxID=45351 RepID=A7RWB2_NEMVE|nr:predicted protein [Nematostella vectensis]|eukprot:XP_001636346.1 predicted protein [Nematostella vectensis]
MDTSQIMLSIILLLWRYVNADVCERFFEMPNSILQGHVIKTITTTEKDCRVICKRNSACYSINYIRKRSQCVLNSDTHFGFPEHFISGSAPGAYYATLKPVTSCSNMFCSSGMACKMREDGKTHKCEKAITYTPLGCYVDVKDRAISGFFAAPVTLQYCFKLAEHKQRREVLNEGNKINEGNVLKRWEPSLTRGTCKRGERTQTRGTYSNEGNVLKRGKRTQTRETYSNKGNVLKRGERTQTRGTYSNEGNVLKRGKRTQTRETYSNKGNVLKRGERTQTRGTYSNEERTQTRETYSNEGNVLKRGERTQTRGTYSNEGNVLKRTYSNEGNVLKRGERTQTRGTYSNEGNVLKRGERTQTRGTYSNEGNVLKRGERTQTRGTYSNEGNVLKRGEHPLNQVEFREPSGTQWISNAEDPKKPSRTQWLSRNLIEPSGFPEALSNPVDSQKPSRTQWILRNHLNPEDFQKHLKHEESIKPWSFSASLSDGICLGW